MIRAAVIASRSRGDVCMKCILGRDLARMLVLIVALSACATNPDSSTATQPERRSSPAELMRRGDYIAARNALESLSSRDFSAEMMLAQVALKLNDADAAESAALRAQTLADGDSEKLYQSNLALGEASLANDSAEKALSAFTTARKLAPGMHERDRAIVCCARAELMRGGVAAARRLRDEILRSDIPELPDLDRRLARHAAAPRTGASSSVARPVAATNGSGRRPSGKGIPPPAWVARSSWGARPIKLRNEPDPIGTITRITVHHTADPNGVPGASLLENVARVKAYQAAHQDDKRWADIGYHFVIDRQGRIFEGRELCWQGAHAGNEKANLHNVGIAVMGNFDRIKPTDAQQRSLEKLMEWLIAEYSLPRSAVAGHDDVRRTSTGSGTKCPGKNLDALLEKWKRAR